MGIRDIFSSRMTPEQLAQAKGQAKLSTENHRLAQAAHGHNVGRADQQRAYAELVRRLGEKGAKRAMNDAARGN